MYSLFSNKTEHLIIDKKIKRNIFIKKNINKKKKWKKKKKRKKTKEKKKKITSYFNL
jgi:hypothetical protein